MPIKKEFAGYLKGSGERVMKVHNPVGIFCTYVVENGSSPYAGKEVRAGDIQQEPVDFTPDTPEMLESVEKMIEANEALEGD